MWVPAKTINHFVFDLRNPRLRLNINWKQNVSQGQKKPKVQPSPVGDVAIPVQLGRNLYLYCCIFAFLYLHLYFLYSFFCICIEPAPLLFELSPLLCNRAPIIASLPLGEKQKYYFSKPLFTSSLRSNLKILISEVKCSMDHSFFT